MAIRRVFAAAVAALGFATAAHAESDLEKGFAGALKGCEEWVLNPASWANGPATFVASVGLGDKMGPVDRVDDAALPPQQFRRANHYWRVNSTPGAGYILVVSDQLPICHITGGGDTDLQPTVEAVLSSAGFTARWERVKQETRGEMVSGEYRNRDEPRFSILISRAKQPGQRLDRVQVLATATFNASN